MIMVLKQILVAVRHLTLQKTFMQYGHTERTNDHYGK